MISDKLIFCVKFSKSDFNSQGGKSFLSAPLWNQEYNLTAILVGIPILHYVLWYNSCWQPNTLLWLSAHWKPSYRCDSKQFCESESSQGSSSSLWKLQRHQRLVLFVEITLGLRGVRSSDIRKMLWLVGTLWAGWSCRWLWILWNLVEEYYCLRMKTIFGQMFVSLSLWTARHASSILPIVPAETISSRVHSNGPVLNQSQDRIRIPQGTFKFNERMNDGYLMFKENRKFGKDTFFRTEDDALKDKTQPDMWLKPVARAVTDSGLDRYDQIGKKSLTELSPAWYLMYPATGALVGYVMGSCIGEMYYWVKNVVLKSKSVHHIVKQDKNKLPIA